MNEQIIKKLEFEGKIIKRFPDIHKANSLLQSATRKAEGAHQIPLNEKTSEILFESMYEVFRQIGDAKLWRQGYESRSHEASMDVLKTADIQNRIKLENIDRYRKARHEASYYGKAISPERVREILGLWKDIHKELVEWAGK